MKPWEGRIYSIALLDLSAQGTEPIVITRNDEEELVSAFMSYIDNNDFKKLVGFKTIFDYRYIFSKMMLYRIQSKKFKDIELRDIKQLMDQVKEEFVYFPSKIGTLDNWGKMLLGKGKYGSQELMLRKYIAGDFEYVKNFQLRQLELTKGLYDLFRFSSSGASISPIPTVPEETLSFPSTPSFPNPISTQLKKCPNCLSDQPADSKICNICKQPL